MTPGFVSEAEELLSLHLAELGVDFERQFKYVANRRFRADFAIPRHGLLIEVQGGVFSRKAHGSITGVLADLERGNMAALHGWRVCRVTPAQVADGTAKALISRMLGL